MSDGIVIAGGGLAGQRCAETLRREGFEGPVRIVCGEDHLPYDRPPLSKAFLAGEVEAVDLQLRPEGWHAEQAIELVLGDPVTGIDPDAQQVTLASGATLSYEHLVAATGSRARTLPVFDGLENVHTLRDLPDARRLRATLGQGTRLTVIGAGLIGQEIAATAKGLGAEVTLVEAAALPLERALHPELARWLVDLQREQGVDVRLGVTADEPTVAGGRVTALTLSDGTAVETDELLVAIGVVPNIEWLGDDPEAVLARPEIHVAGDLAGGDHWELAASQGRAVAKAIVQAEPAAPSISGWWSDIHGVRLQGLGDPFGADTLEIDGDPAERSFSAVALRDGRAVAALAVGRPRDVPGLRARLTDDQ
ncbi:unannotated protein [freshwater metagenome]|uniref:Unannotated protein n=1 Tax=freshwater metagenome TaxID=449393 RepID=A0A6J7EHW2_9ZZZZ|nr:NAD(P)/FAD-dependent oxidoreductase [Actinomycetota bacterium]